MGLNLRKIGQTIGNVVSSGVKDVGNLGSLAAADITGNQVAQQHASQALQNSAQPVIQAIQNNVVQPVEQTAQNFVQSPLASVAKLGLADITSNPTAAQNATTQLKANFNKPKQQLTTVKNGKIVINPTVSKQILGLANGVGEAGPLAEGEAESAIQKANKAPSLPNSSLPKKNLTPGDKSPAVEGKGRGVPLSNLSGLVADTNGQLRSAEPIITPLTTSLENSGKIPVYEGQTPGALGSYSGTGIDFEKGTGKIKIGALHDNTTLVHEVAHKNYEALPVEHQGVLDYALKNFNEKNPGAFSTTNNPAENIALAAEDFIQNRKAYGGKFSNELVRNTPNGKLLFDFLKKNADDATNNIQKVKPKVSLKGSASDAQILKSLGASEEDIPALLQKDQAQQAAIQNRQLPVPDSNAGVGEVSKSIKQQLTTPAPRTIEENTALNPLKISVPDVQPGNYKLARALPGSVRAPIQLSAELAYRSAKSLYEKEGTNINDLAENPSLAKTSLAKDALAKYQDLTNRIHATSQALGGNTNYLKNYDIRNYDLEDKGTQEALTKLNGGVPVDPKDFNGIDNLSRMFNSRAEATGAGLKFANADKPYQDISDYANPRTSKLGRQALVKGATEADMGGTVKSRSLDLGNGQVIPLSDKGIKEFKAFEPHVPTDNKIIKGARTANAEATGFLLTGGQFHPINIAALRAAPTLAAEGHLGEATSGLGRTFGVLAPGGRARADAVLNKALQDGTAQKAAQIGMPYGGGSFSEEGSFVDNAVGHGLVFGKQMPMMHDQVARSVIADLEKKGVPLDSEAAVDAGTAGNNLMGAMNKEVQNVSPKVNQAMSDFLLAKQFTPSKFSTLKYATKSGVAGSYARRALVANVAASAAIIGGIGYLVHQKSDDVKDILLRSIFDPAVPTPLKDSKGNTLKFRTPGTDTSDLAKLLGFKLTRGQDGHLDVNWKPSNMPSTIEDYLRARLAPVASGAVKIATNENFAGKPLFDPNASLGQKLEQAGTSLISGQLPIGLQGVPMLSGVEKHLPGGVQAVLNAQKSGSNPLIKSLGSSFGLTPTTDTTVGKGQQSAQYYDALDQAQKGLNRQEKDALDLYAGSKKNPVTGKYDIVPNANDARVKATALLQNPKVIGNLIAMNQKLSQEGQKTDPLWSESKDDITKYLQYSAMLPGSADKTNWFNNNQSWYSPLASARNTFFNSLPPGDPNKPKLDLQYPDASPQVSALQDQYNNLTDSTQKGNFLTAHPELIQQWDKQAVYTNQFREALGASPLKNYPASTPYIDQQLAAKNYKDPQVQAYLDKVSEYNVIKGGANAQFQGTQLSQSALKGVQDLANYGIVQNPDGSLATVGSGLAQPGATSTNKSSSYSKSKYYIRAHSSKPYIKKAYLGKAGKSKTPKIAKAGYKPKALGFAPKGTPKAPKVSLKASAV